MRNCSVSRRLAAMCFLGITVAIGPFGQSYAQDADQNIEATEDVHPTNTEEGKERAMLVASLAEFGQRSGDALALLSAARILDGMEIGVARRDGSHQLDNAEHGPSGLFSVDELVAQAREIANQMSAQEAEDILAIAERIAGGYQQVSFQGYLHTHWVWWCGFPYFPPEWCEYRWVSHY